MEAVFYNKTSLGDLHLSRSHINKLVELFPEIKFYYSHNYYGILKDCTAEFLPNKHEELNFCADITEKDDTIFLNAWVGANGRKTGVTFKSAQDLFTYYCEFLSYTIKKKVNFPLVTPFIDYNKYNIQKVDEYFTGISKDKVKVFICNNIPATGSGGTHSLDNWIKNLAEKYTGVNFYVTNPTNFQLDNVIYAELIIGGEGSKLNELSYFSTFCDVIIGRGSGPFTFTHVKDNFNKVWAAITHSPVANDLCCGILYYQEAHNSYLVHVKDENEIDFEDLLRHVKK